MVADEITIPLPATGFMTAVRLDRAGGRDQVAEKARREGWAAFERPLPEVFYRAAQAVPGLVLDVGANTGFYSLLAVAAHPRNQVLAFEPLPAVRRILQGNIDRNRLGPRITALGCAIGDRNGEAALYIPSQEHGLVETSASLRSDFKEAHSAILPVASRRLDRVLLRPSWFLRRVTIIKVDVEGCEAAVLAGAERTVARHRPILFIEVLPRADLAALSAFLRRHRYGDVVLPPDAPAELRSEIGFVPDAWNHALVPLERCAAFRRLAEAGAGPGPADATAALPVR